MHHASGGEGPTGLGQTAAVPCPAAATVTASEDGLPWDKIRHLAGWTPGVRFAIEPHLSRLPRHLARVRSSVGRAADS